MTSVLMNAMVSGGVITITGGNIAACDISFPLKQTKQCLIRGVSFHFKEPLSEVGRYSVRGEINVFGEEIEKQSDIVISDYFFYLQFRKTEMR